MELQEYQQVFDRRTKDRCSRLDMGGRFNRSWLEADEQQHIEERCNIIQGWIDDSRMSLQTQDGANMPHVHFDLVDNGGIDALAFDAEGEHFIGLYYGALVLVPDMFNRLFARPDILPGLGNSTVEAASAFTLPRWATHINQLIQARETQGLRYPIVPNDSYRHQYADLLSGLVIYYLIHHEIAHQRYGHVRLMNQLTGIGLLPELGWSAETNVSNISIHVLEMDADAWAACQVLNLIVTVISLPYVRSLFWSDKEDPLQAGIWDFGFAVHFLLRLFASERPTTLQIKDLPYPPQRLRSMMITAAVQEWITRHYGEVAGKNAMRSMAEAGGTAEQAYCAFTGNWTSQEASNQVAGAEYTSHFGLIIQEWKTVVRPELIPLTYASDLIS